MKKKVVSKAAFCYSKPLFGIATLCLLHGCATTSDKYYTGSKIENVADLVCENAERFAARQIGDGHCVSLIRRCTDAPFTSAWRPGIKVLGQTLAAGTIIATFKNQRYPSKHGYHAAIYIKQDARGIWVWDQWRGKPVHRRLIRVRNDGADPGNTAQAYRVVKLARNH